ncbi:MAG: GMC family oxidoreductase [Verrucomicrobia bacterium]|nr:GMC family oxidoreductase [Verrucomicrobiota bacterium]
MPNRFSQQDDTLAVVIGSGAGGGTLGHELAKKGIRTVILEAGPRIEAHEHLDDEVASHEQLSWLDQRTTSGTWSVAKNYPNSPAWLCKAVGGTTLRWAGCCPRFLAHEFRARDVYGEMAGTSLLNWPLQLDELEPYYDRAEDKMGVTGTHGVPMLRANNNQRIMAVGAKRIGYRDVSTGAMAINPVPRDGRPGSIYDGFCYQGIRSNARWSTLNAEIPKGEATGKLEVRERCHVLRIEADTAGKVNGVIYADRDGVHQRQRARLVCLAGNAIETPRILLNSCDSRFPDGLANSSGQVGKNYMRHVSGTVFGIFDQPVRMYRGNVMAGQIKDEHHFQPKRGFVGGYLFETIALGPTFLALQMQPGAWGRRFTADLETYERMAGMWITGEDMPRPGNAVTLHPDQKDQFGLPIPNVHVDDHPNDLAMQKHAYLQGSRVYEAAGAVRTIHTPSYPSGHNMGTCRMSERPEEGVCNKWGQTHDISNLFISDGSLFTTSGAPNPTLTIVALVIRQSEYIAEQLNKLSI